jgi:hypothetical protein
MHNDHKIQEVVVSDRAQTCDIDALPHGVMIRMRQDYIKFFQRRSLKIVSAAIIANNSFDVRHDNHRASFTKRMIEFLHPRGFDIAIFALNANPIRLSLRFSSFDFHITL